MEKERRAQGHWIFLLNAVKAHYFVAGRSLCGRWACLTVSLTANKNSWPDDTSENCKECRKRKRKVVLA
jgi:hypothetical protein